MAISEELARSMFTESEIAAEREQIDKTFRSLRFADKVRQTTLACYKKCGGEMVYPFRVEPFELTGSNEVCFGDCLNINFEKGPFLPSLGEVPSDVVPKKFLWAHGQ